MADASACRIGHDGQRSGCHPASRVRCAGLRPPLTPGDSQNTTDSTHSIFKRGYFKGGLLKIEAARAIGANIDHARSSSRSFRAFSDAIIEACA
jgi:hypothetical protein